MPANTIKKRDVKGLGKQDTDRSAVTICITKPHKTVLSYLLYAYKGVLLCSHQRSEIRSKITIVVVTSPYLFQWLALILPRNYSLFTIALIATQHDHGQSR